MTGTKCRQYKASKSTDKNEIKLNYTTQKINKINTNKWKSSSKEMHLDNVVVSSRLMRFVIFGVLQQYFIHVGRRVLEQLVRAAEDDERDLAVAQHRQLVRLLHDAELALVERHLHNRTLHAIRGTIYNCHFR